MHTSFSTRAVGVDDKNAMVVIFETPAIPDNPINLIIARNTELKERIEASRIQTTQEVLQVLRAMEARTYLYIWLDSFKCLVKASKWRVEFSNYSRLHP